MDSKECERALTRAIKSLDETAAKEACRALVRALDQRVPTLAPSLTDKRFEVRDIDAFARSEGVIARRTEEGPGRVLVRIRDALNITSFARLCALSRDWDASGDSWLDVARAAQPSLFEWWQRTHDVSAMFAIASDQERFAGGARNTALAIAQIVDEMRPELSPYFTAQCDEAIELARAVIDRGELASADEAAQLRAASRALEYEAAFSEWSPATPATARAVTAMLGLAIDDSRDEERANEALVAIESFEAALENTRWLRGSARAAQHTRARSLEQRRRVLRERFHCPELEQWVARCASRRERA